MSETKKAPEMKVIALADIQTSSTNPRTFFDEDALQGLTDSIREKGVIQPIVVRPNPGKGKKYELVCGERRFKAAVSINTAIKDRNNIPAIIRELTDDECMELQIIENLQRKDVHPMEEAAGFKRIVDKLSEKNKNHTEVIQELAKRVGKAASFVAQRLRFNDLIPEYQKCFFKNWISANEAFQIIRLSAKSQKEMWTQHHKNETSPFDVSAYEMNQFLGKLKTAPFDTKDPNLKKDMGACTTCPHNSGSNALLFPDENGMGTCGLVSCFTQKCNIAYDRDLKAAVENPDMVLIVGRYGDGGADSDKIRKAGHKVLKESENYNDIQEPGTWEDYLENQGIDREDYDTEKEYKDALTRERKDYDKEATDYEKAKKSGKYINAFALEGNDKGKIVLIELKKAGKAGPQSQAAFKEKESSGKVTSDDISLQMAGIRERAKRANELDEEKIAPEVFELLKKEKRFNENFASLSGNEKIAHIILLFDYCGQMSRSKLAKIIGKGAGDYRYMSIYKHLQSFNERKLDMTINAMVRALVIDKMEPTNGCQVESHGMSAIVQDISFDYNQGGTKKIREAQMAVRKTRQARVDERLQDLTEKKKEFITAKKKKK